MRLIRTATLQLEEFVDSDDAPNYAILSHTWGSEEVSFADFAKPESRHREGFKKIERCCALARSRGHDFVWIDTCCIDKSSSAELSEAINSMYLWYWESDECFAYLSDVRVAGVQGDWRSQFEQSRWFTRGWTLQEMVAPSRVIFYDADWTELGSKGELAGDITAITGIRAYNLCRNPRDASIAQKMSWAASRKTTRVEDVAYCLLGLFDINMSLLYGERDKAFQRLQEEILRRSDDESIFAWTNCEYVTSGLLATSPADFKNAGNIVTSTHLERLNREPFSYTNKGLQLDMQGWEVWSNKDDASAGHEGYFTPTSIICAPICCKTKGSGRSCMVIFLIRFPDMFPNRTQRVLMDEMVSVGEGYPQAMIRDTIYIHQHFTTKQMSKYWPIPVEFARYEGVQCAIKTRPMAGYLLNWILLAAIIVKKNSLKYIQSST